MEVVHKEFWQQNFQISPAENTTFDPDTETEVTQTLQQQHLILTSQTISLDSSHQTTLSHALSHQKI